MPIKPEDFDTVVPDRDDDHEPAKALATPQQVNAGKTGGAVFAYVLAGILAITTAYFAYQASNVQNTRSSQTSHSDALEYDRRDVAYKWPIAISKIDLSNTDKNGRRLQGGINCQFDAKNLRYLTWAVEGPNLAFGLREVSGKLYVKFVDPDGRVMTVNDSPKGFTESVDIQVSSGNGEWNASSGLGSDEGGSFPEGTWRLEFWFDGNEIGEKSFTVN